MFKNVQFIFFFTQTHFSVRPFPFDESTITEYCCMFIKQISSYVAQVVQQKHCLRILWLLKVTYCSSYTKVLKTFGSLFLDIVDIKVNRFSSISATHFLESNSYQYHDREQL